MNSLETELQPQAQEFRTHFHQTLQSLCFLKSLNLEGYKTSGEEVWLPDQETPRKTLIFDLDETLIHCNENQEVPSDVSVEVVFPTGEKIKAGINVRPGAQQIIEDLAKDFEIIIFTASHFCYANPVIDYLDPKKLVSHRLFR